MPINLVVSYCFTVDHKIENILIKNVLDYV